MNHSGLDSLRQNITYSFHYSNKYHIKWYLVQNSKLREILPVNMITLMNSVTDRK